MSTLTYLQVQFLDIRDLVKRLRVAGQKASLLKAEVVDTRKGMESETYVILDANISFHIHSTFCVRISK